MSERIDHISEAQRYLNDLKTLEGQHLELDMHMAQVHATIALVEQQRIANRIALATTIASVEMEYKQNGCRAHLAGDTGLFNYTQSPDGASLKPEIKEALGI